MLRDRGAAEGRAAVGVGRGKAAGRSAAGAGVREALLMWQQLYHSCALMDAAREELPRQSCKGSEL